MQIKGKTFTVYTCPKCKQLVTMQVDFNRVEYTIPRGEALTPWNMVSHRIIWSGQCPLCHCIVDELIL